MNNECPEYLSDSPEKQCMDRSVNISDRFEKFRRNQNCCLARSVSAWCENVRPSWHFDQSPILTSLPIQGYTWCWFSPSFVSVPLIRIKFKSDRFLLGCYTRYCISASIPIVLELAKILLMSNKQVFRRRRLLLSLRHRYRSMELRQGRMGPIVFLVSNVQQ